MDIKSLIRNIAKQGQLEKEVPVLDTVFTLRVISLEEQFLVDGISNLDNIKEKYKADGKINSYADTIQKMRNLSLLSFLIVKINGVSPVEETLNATEKLTRHIEFRDELSELPPHAIDKILDGYRELMDESEKLYADLPENLGK